MDPENARKLVDKVCEEIDEKHQEQPRFGEVLKMARTVGFGIAMGLAVVGCGDDDDTVPEAGPAYGMPDSVLIQDAGADMVGKDVGVYGVPDGWGIGEAAVPYGIPPDSGQ